jgi:signal transduction histidine kinase
MFTASADFEAIAQSQILIAVQTLHLVSIVLYLAQTAPDGQSQWVELVSYPKGTPPSLPFLLPSDPVSIVRQERIIVPLVYEDTMLGLLISEKEQSWTAPEQQQIEEIAHTLAIACTLDQRCQWLLSQQEQRYNQEQDFLANLLHQIKNPLTAIRTFGQILVKRLMANDPNYRIAKGIVRETIHLQELLENVHDRPLLQSAPHCPLLPPAPTELINVLEPLVSSFGELAQSKQIQFSALLPDRSVLVKGDSSALREVLSNILDNALKYNHPGGAVSLVVEVDQPTCTIVVQDTGMGIATEDLPHIFERHYRGHQSQGTIEGSGLGLAIAKQLLEGMGGTIEVDSKEGEGTKVSVKLALVSSQ